MTTKKALQKTSWNVIADSTKNYVELYEEFDKLARSHGENGEEDEASAVGLLAAVCSMLFSTSNSISEPYVPYWTVNGRSSAGLDYFENEEILRYFNEIFSLLKNYPLLRARIGDVLWLLSSPKDFKHAQGAIDGYLSLEIGQNSWHGNYDQCWQRVIIFTKQLGNGGKNQLKKIEKILFDAFIVESASNSKFAQRLSDLLLYEGFADKHAEKIAKTMDKHAKKFSRENEFTWAQEGFRQTSVWYAKANKDDESLKAEVAIGDCLVAEAEFKRDEQASGILICGELFDRALQLYRQVPSEKRGKLRIKNKIEKVSLAKENANRQAVNYMLPQEVGTIDYREIHKLASQVVQSENPLECLRSLASMSSGFDIDTFEGEIKNKKHGFFRPMFSSVHMTDTGQIAAKAPSIGVEAIDSASEGYKEWMSIQLHQRYQILMKLQVNGLILPALWEMRQKHRLTERFFINLAYWSPSVPVGRERLVGKALYNGYELEFATAIHIISPQIEHIVRTYLKQAQVNTRHTSQDGIDIEKGLSSLAGDDMPEFEQIFGRNFAHEIRMLFCEGAGPNLRNNVAHGLLDDRSSQSSPYSLYAWWFFLKLVFSSFHNSESEQ